MSAHSRTNSPTPPSRRRALVVGLRLSNQSDSEVRTSAREMARLARTLGIAVVDSEVQSRSAPSPSSYLGSGKVAELRDRIADGSESLGLVIVDGELTPRQQHTLEHEFECPVLDRTAVILEIFETRARTREARLEVEMARLRYELPRLRETTAGDDRRGGGGRGGRGHTNVELEKDRIRARLRELETELEARATRASGRRTRDDAPFRVALVGYTNAGKSSIMQGLTASDGLVEDKLFATLGTTVRRLDPPTTPPIVLSDTVGFVSRLPHELVASFRSTLEEAAGAGHLLLVVDASDPAWQRQLDVTRATLEGIGADAVPWTLVLNKWDRVEADRRERLGEVIPGAVRMSALDLRNLNSLREHLMAVRDRGLSEESLVVPFAAGAVLAEVHDGARILETTHTPHGTCLRVRASEHALDRWRSVLEQAPGAAGPVSEPADAQAARYGLDLSVQADGTEGDAATTDDSGLDYRVMHAVDADEQPWILRIPRRPELFAGSRLEGRALRLLDGRLPAKIPRWHLHAPELIAYPRLPGTPAWTLTGEGVQWNGIDPEDPPAPFLADLAAVLAAMERIPESDLRSAGVPVQPIAEIREEYRAMIDRTRPALEPPSEVLRRWHRWLDDDRLWPDRPSLIHGDLHPGHLLLDDDARVTGILDWSEVQMGDPGRDLALFVGCFGTGALTVVLDALEAAGSPGWPGRHDHALESWAFNPVRMADWALTHENDEVLAHARVQLGWITS